MRVSRSYRGFITVYKRTDRDNTPGVREALRPGLALEIWDERHLLRLLGERFGVSLSALSEDDLLALRNAVDHAKGAHAFGDGFQNDPLQATRSSRTSACTSHDPRRPPGALAPAPEPHTHGRRRRLINLAARLNTVAGCDEIVVSNTLYQRLPDPLRAEFQDLPPVEAKNIGRIHAWKLDLLRPPVA